MKEGEELLRNIEKNSYKLYYKRDIEDLGLLLYQKYPENFYSQSRLKRELKISLTEEQLNNPHAFALGKNGYYPLWDRNILETN